MAITDGLRILHMRDAARSIVKFTRGKTRDHLDDDELFQLAMTHLVEIMGEAATKVSEPTRNRYPEIPWRRIIDTRNQLIHGYPDVKYEVLWQIMTVHVPELLPALELAASEAEP